MSTSTSSADGQFGREYPKAAVPSIASLAGKVAIITGSSSGLGRAIALAYVASGAFVVCADLTPNPPKAIAPEGAFDTVDQTTPTHELINMQASATVDSRPAAIFVHCNTTSAASVEETVARCVQQYGRLDIMVNNAGILAEMKTEEIFPPIYKTPESVWDNDMAVNGKGVWLGCKYASAQMLGQEPFGDLPNGDRGWIINMCSVVGLVGDAGVSCYAASKGAVLQLTKAAALDLAKDRIHVNCINPGFVDTNLLAPMKEKHGSETAMAMLSTYHPWGRAGKVEDIAKMAVFLAGDGASWCTGAAFVVDGGYTAR